MARTPTVYRFDDVGAPDINTIMPSSNDKKRLFIHTILKACLVDGYGAKAAAGWTMPHEEITPQGCRFVLKNAAKTGALLHEGGVFCNGSTDLRSNALWACSDVSNMDAPDNAWSHNIKYDDRLAGGNTDIHKTGLYQGSSCDAWFVIANENTAIVYAGRSGVEFDTSSSGTAAASIVTSFMFGAMRDNNGGLANPGYGNFYIAGGMMGAYAGTVWYNDYPTDLITTYLDVIGFNKTQTHSYIYKKPSYQGTHSPLSAWLPVPVVFMQYGPSAPDGDASNRLHFLAALPSIRKLMLHPFDVNGLNTFMLNNSFEYGKSISYQGSDWVIIKDVKDVVLVCSLAPSEWGA